MIIHLSSMAPLIPNQLSIFGLFITIHTLQIYVGNQSTVAPRYNESLSDEAKSPDT